MADLHDYMANLSGFMALLPDYMANLGGFMAFLSGYMANLYWLDHLTIASILSFSLASFYCSSTIHIQEKKTIL